MCLRPALDPNSYSCHLKQHQSRNLPSQPCQPVQRQSPAHVFQAEWHPHSILPTKSKQFQNNFNKFRRKYRQPIAPAGTSYDPNKGLTSHPQSGHLPPFTFLRWFTTPTELAQPNRSLGCHGQQQPRLHILHHQVRLLWSQYLSRTPFNIVLDN